MTSWREQPGVAGLVRLTRDLGSERVKSVAEYDRLPAHWRQVTVQERLPHERIQLQNYRLGSDL